MIWIIIIVVLLFIAMLCRSLVHTLLHHYNDFKVKFNIKNDQWWNPVVSWENKYDKTELRKGKVVRNKKIVQLSDAFHFFNMIELGCFTLAITIPVSLWLGAVWYIWILIFTIIGVVIILSFNLFYDKIWR